jgi:hypothetical protein
MNDDNDLAGCPAGFLTRAAVARRLGVGISSVRRLEGRVLHPVVDVAGTHRFDPREVDAHAETSARQRRPRRATSAHVANPVAPDAEVFELFQAGRCHADVVIATKLSSEEVRRLYGQWRAGYATPTNPAPAVDPEQERARESAEVREWKEQMRALTAVLGEDSPETAAERRARRRARRGQGRA